MSIKVFLKDPYKKNDLYEIYKYASQLCVESEKMSLSKHKGQPGAPERDEELLTLMSNLFTKDDFDKDGKLKTDISKKILVLATDSNCPSVPLEPRESERMTATINALYSYQQGSKEIKDEKEKVIEAAKTPKEIWEEYKEKWDKHCRNIKVDPQKKWESLEKNWESERKTWVKNVPKESTVKDKMRYDVLKACDDRKFYLENQLKISKRKGMNFFLESKLKAVELLEKYLELRIIESYEDQVNVSSKRVSDQLTQIINDFPNVELFQNSQDDKQFFNSLLDKVSNATSIFHSFKRVFTSSTSREKYGLSDEEGKQLTNLLKQYINARRTEGKSMFGFSREEKINAAKTLINALDPQYRESPDLPAKLEACKNVLQDGMLGNIIRDYVKSKSDKNTVGGFIEHCSNEIRNNIRSYPRHML